MEPQARNSTPNSVAGADPRDLWRHVSRAPLIDRLMADPSWSLAAISAGPGSGKTELLTEWTDLLRARSQPVLRVECTNRARSAPDFLLDLINQLLPGPARMAVLDRFASDSIAHLAREFVDLLAASQQGQGLTILLDDYDRSASEDVNGLVTALAATAGQRCRFVVAAREQVRIAASGTINLSDQDLRISDDDIAALFDDDLEPDALASISAFADGNASAVHLLWVFSRLQPAFLNSLAGFSVTGRIESATDLVRTIIALLSDDAREGLIATAFLAKFPIELVQKLCDQPAPWQWMEPLERLGLITLDDGGTDEYVRRCQPQFRQELLHLLNRRGRVEQRRLASLASSWFEENDELLKAVQCAAMVGSAAQVAQLIETAGGVEIGISRGAQELSELLGHLPTGSLSQFPRLSLAQAYIFVKEGKFQIANEIIAGVRATALPDRPLDPKTARDLAIVDVMLTAHTAGLLSAPDRDRVAEMEASPSAAEPLVRATLNNVLCAVELGNGELDDAAARGDAAIHFYTQSNSPNGIAHMHIHLGRIALYRGQPALALEHFSTGRERFLDRRLPDFSGSALANVFSAAALFDLGRIDEAAAHCQTSLPLAEYGERYDEVLYSGYRTLWAIARLKGESATAARILDTGVASGRRLRNDTLSRMLEMHWLEMSGETPEALLKQSAVAALLETADDEAGILSWREKDQRAIARAQDAVEHDDAPGAIAILEAAELLCATAGRLRDQVSMRLKTAACHERLGQRAMAFAAISDAITLAAPSNLMGPFLEEWHTLTTLLPMCLPETGLANADQDEARFISDILKTGSAISPLKQSIFSDREQEILEHLVRGESNKLIARALGISPETVRFHLKRIYGKFGVRIGHKARDVVVDLIRTRNYTP